MMSSTLSAPPVENDGTLRGGPVQYSVRKVKEQWQLWTPGKRQAILRSNNREELVHLAAQIACSPALFHWPWSITAGM